MSPGKRAAPVPDISRLEAQGLQKAYGSRKVVKDVSLAVFKGEVVGLLGPNGAGKTTSFYMLVGLLRSDAGQILLDEPFAGIDPIAVIEIQRIIGFLKSRGIGVLITDHNVRETLGICDRAYIINDGHVLTSGTPAEIVENADVRRVYLGEHFRM
ncbi:MAG: ATP-binding cassette domain-containing protein [Hydrogenophaga sp.]|nr:ATP-binding cassette domain-containing protein [Hydrogenophaga sp.]